MKCETTILGDILGRSGSLFANELRGWRRGRRQRFYGHERDCGGACHRIE